MAEEVKDYALKKGIDIGALVLVAAVAVATILAVVGGTFLQVLATI